MVTLVHLDQRACPAHLVRLATTGLLVKMAKMVILVVPDLLDPLDQPDHQDILVKTEDLVHLATLELLERTAKTVTLEAPVKMAKMDTLVDQDPRVLQDHQVTQELLVKMVIQEDLDPRVTLDHLAIQEVPESLDCLEHQATYQVQLVQLGHQARMATQEAQDQKVSPDQLDHQVTLDCLELRV